MKRSALALVFLFLFLALSSFGFAQTVEPVGKAWRSGFPSAPGPKYVPDRILVRFRPKTLKATTAAAHAAVGAQTLRAYTVVDGLQLVRLAPGMTVHDALQVYRQNPDVLYAEPDYVRHMDVTPNDPQWPSLWGLANIRASEAWDRSTGSSTVVVGVIDTGVDYNHPDLAANIYSNAVECNGGANADNDGNGYKNDCHGLNAITGAGDPMDDNGHGTHVAGTIGAVGNNGLGVVGVNWAVKVLPCKALDASGNGYDSNFIECLQYLGWMYDHGAKIVAINASWGGSNYSQALSDAIGEQIYRGILFVAAAGNDGANNDTSPYYPADYYLANLVAVAAIDNSNGLASFSNYGKRSVHLGAPGVNILSTLPGNQYAGMSGTSMAAPHVTGVAALLAAQQPWRSWIAIRNLMLAGGTITPSLHGSTLTGKRLDAYGATTCVIPLATAILQPGSVGTATTAVGSKVQLAALDISCATPAAPNNVVTVQVSPGGSTVSLYDNGAGGDQVAGDGIYSAQWTAPAVGTYTFTFPWGDSTSVQVLANYYVGTWGSPYPWRDICGSGTPLLGLGDDDVLHVSPGFQVNFGQGHFDSFYVSSNGTIAFDGAFRGWSPTLLPTSATPTLVAPWWDDLRPNANDRTHTVYWKTSGVAPNREVVVAWCAVPHYGSANLSDNVTFEVVMSETIPDVYFLYQDTAFGGSAAGHDHGATATVGIQSSLSTGINFSYQTASLTDGLVLHFGVNYNPPPDLTSISPSTVAAGASAFELTVRGSNFVPNSVVRWNGSNRTTYFDSSTQLRATIPSSDVALAGSASVTVFNPGPGGGGGGLGLTFTIGGANPVPTISFLDPPSVAGSLAPLTITIYGSGFVPGSVAYISGHALATRYTNASILTADVDADFHAVVGTWSVQVVNPPPGGGTSNSKAFNVTSNIAPQLNLLAPSSVAAGGTGFTLSVTGWIFPPGAVVKWQGSPRDTQRLDATHLTAAIPASDLVAPGYVSVAVSNPAPGGGDSAPLYFTILAPEAYSTNLSPNPLSMSKPSSEAVTLRVTALGAFTHTVHLACRLPLPTGMSCAYSQNDFVPSLAGTLVTLTLSTTAATPLGANLVHLDISGSASSVPTRTLDIAVNVLSGLRFVPVAPCRVADTRNPIGPFGGPFLKGGASRAFGIPYAGCGIPDWAQAYSVNLTVVPRGPLGFLTAYPCGQPLPLASNLNSLDGRVKAVAAIVPAGSGGGMCAYASDDTDLVMDINGYFTTNADPNALAFFPMAPCRLVDTRNPNGPLGGPALAGGVARTFPIATQGPCNMLGYLVLAKAYSLNYTVIPKRPLGYLTTWPAGQDQPLVSTLNAISGAVTANAAIVPAGSGGSISVYATADTDLVIDINGYFATPGPPPNIGGLSLYNLTPCRVLDTRDSPGSPPFSGVLDVHVTERGCGAPASAGAFVMNATVVPPGPLGFLTLWPQGTTQPLVSTLNAPDGSITSNLAIVPANQGSNSAYASDKTHLVLDVFGYFAY